MFLSSLSSSLTVAHVVPGAVTPLWEPTYNMSRSTIAMICNSSGRVDPLWASQWGLIDLDWNGNKKNWSSASPMNVEEDMRENMEQVKAINPLTKTWVYRNGIKALPWHTSVRTKLEDRQYWGYFMPYANCSTSPGVYVCGPNATMNLYHDFEQTPTGNCGVGVQCGEYVFNHRNTSLSSFLLGEYFFDPVNGMGNPLLDGVYVDDDWSSSGPSEMDKDAVEKMGMSPEDVSAMRTAWLFNQQAWRDALVSASKFEWFLFYGGQQTAPGQNQTCGQCTCQTYLEKNCGEYSPSQNGTLFYGYSRISHSNPFPLPSPDQDLAAFLLTRGQYSYFGYGWSGCIDATHPFTRPANLNVDYGSPINYCSETAPGIWQRNYEKYTIQLDCNKWQAEFTPV